MCFDSRRRIAPAIADVGRHRRHLFVRQLPGEAWHRAAGGVAHGHRAPAALQNGGYVYLGAGTTIGYGLSVYVERTLANSSDNEPDSTWVTVFYDF